MPGSWSDFLKLRSGPAPPPSSEAGAVRVYADANGALRSIQSDGTDAAIGGGGGSLPAGGTTGEVLTKASNADGDADWEVAPSFVPTAIKLANGATTDIHTAGASAVTWNSATNPATGDPIVSVPAALGLSIDLTGVSPDIIATADGTWAFTLLVALSADATVKAGMAITSTDAALEFGPVAATDGSTLFGISTSTVTTGEAVALTPFNVNANTLAAAAANPYTIYCELTIVRLA